MQASEEAISSAVARYKSQQRDPSPKRAGFGKVAADFGISKSTLSNRVNGKTLDRHSAHAYCQNLTPAEELVLVDYICRLQDLHHPATATLVRDTASLIRQNRINAETSTNVQLEPMGQSWLQKFKKRHPTVQSDHTTWLDQLRIDGTQPELLEKWILAYKAKIDEHHYPPSHIYNMDETGYAIGSSQSSPCVVTKDPLKDGLISKKAASGKPTKASAGRQEWVTTLECVSASGRALKPTVIFKAQGQMNPGWLPEDVDVKGWQWMTTFTGWTNNTIGDRWIEESFEPQTRPEDPNQRRVLIADGHSSHITPFVISFCIKNAIDLLILPPHSSHKTQPLDVSCRLPPPP